MQLEDIRNNSRGDWDAVVASVVSGPVAPAGIVWRGHRAIMQALAPFMGENRNHAHLPTGGGVDFLSVGPSAESGCLEFMVDDRYVQIMKPRSLTLELIDSPGNSFLLLELDNLDPSGVYETDEKEPEADKDAEHLELKRFEEELVEVAPADYVSREIWDRGSLHDENGDEIPIPDNARLVMRLLQGKVLLVAKGSLWNSDPATYDGRHNTMTAAQIRRIIERSLAR